MSSTVLPPAQAWRALAALCLGFFMILLDQTIVAVATPGIMADFDARLDQVVWVTSIYLLCLLVPLLFTGRLATASGNATSSAWVSRCSPSPPSPRPSRRRWSCSSRLARCRASGQRSSRRRP